MSAAERVGVAVVIVSWNTRELLDRAVRSVLESATVVPTALYVVDNGSMDGSAELVAEAYPEVVLIGNNRNVGYGQANNQGIEASSEPFVLLLNSDAELLPDTIEALVQELREHPEAAIVGARLHYLDGSFQASYNDFPSLWTEFLVLAGLARVLLGPRYPSHSEADSRVGRDVDWVGGACLVARRHALEMVGGFDPEFHMYCEEMDLCRRVARCGWRVRYCPKAVALHRGGGSVSRVEADQPRMLWASRRKYFRKHHGWLAACLLGAMVRAAYGTRACWWSARAMVASRQERARWWLRARAALGVLLAP